MRLRLKDYLVELSFMVVMSILLVGIYLAARPISLPVSRPQIKYGSIVRLSDRVAANITYFCSGTVISPNVILTALHCVTHHRANNLMSDRIEVRPASNHSLQLYGVPYDPHPELDQVLLRGDFREFEVAPVINTNAYKLVNFTQPLVACGYPDASRLICIPIAYRETVSSPGDVLDASFFFAEFIGPNFVISGMSGGPVFNANGDLIGVIIANNRNDIPLIQQLSYISPIYGIILDMNILDSETKSKSEE